VRDLLRPRHPVERVHRHPVPALDRRAHAVDDERVVVEVDCAEADRDAELRRLVQRLLAHAVRPPELRRDDAKHDLASDLDRADAVLEPHLREDLGRRIERDRPPDALMDDARAEVPAVAHAALVHPHLRGAADLRLVLGAACTATASRWSPAGRSTSNGVKAPSCRATSSPPTKTVASWSTPSKRTVPGPSTRRR